MYIVNNVKLELESTNIKKAISKKLKIEEKDLLSYKYYKKALDCRDKEHIFYVCNFIVDVNKKVINKIKRNKAVKEYLPFNLKIVQTKSNKKVMVVGMGPCGLFASYILALSGVKVVLIERGKKVEDRVKDVEKFFKDSKLDENSNLQYGEGGAGTFSDGKLTTNINDKRIEFIKNTFIKFGANEEIYYLSKPHIGSDVLVDVVKNFRNELLKLGVEIHFSTTLEDIKVENNELKSVIIKNNIDNKKNEYLINDLILATGHSARDIFYMLDNHGVKLERKPFSIGVRIEHNQDELNKFQYGEKYYKNKCLPASDYKLAVHLDNNRSLHTFCMCPGGVVVASSSNENEIVTNGMSYFARDKENANSALLVNVNEDDLGQGLFAGIKFQEKYEKLAYELSNSYKAPCQLLQDLYDNKDSLTYKSVKPSYLPGVTFTNLRKCLPQFVIDTLIKGLPLLDKKINGFNNGDALLTAPETRSSSPIRIVRDESYQTNIKGIYPSGEGSGYSSGITTSALDGIRVAFKVIEKLK